MSETKGKKRSARSSKNVQVSRQAKHDKRGTVRVAGATIDLLRDPDQIKDWDDEELERGRRRDKNGSFRGSGPVIVPIECHRELNRRRVQRANEMMSQMIEPAMKELRAIIDSPTAEDKDKLTAIKMALDRGLGAAPQAISVSVETPKWQQALTSGIVAMPGDDEDIEEADVIWDSEDQAS